MMLTCNQHDALVLLAEGVSLDDVAAVFQWQDHSLRAALYSAAKALEVPPQGDFYRMVDALRAEAIARGYADEVYFFMWEPDLAATMPRPRPCNPLPRKEG